MTNSIEKLKNIIKEELNKVIHEELLPEGGYTKLLQSLAGLEPSIDTIGIVTAENPMAQKISSQENKIRNKELARDIRALSYGFYQIGGKYGTIEKPYVIPNVSYKDIIAFGKDYNQESVIFVEKQRNNRGMLAHLIYTGKKEPEEISRVVLPLIHDIEDFYSIYKGRKFVIPFFDEFFKDIEMKSGKLSKRDARD